jgi:TPR repeat protein
MRILFLAILLSLCLSLFVQSWAGEGASLKNGIASPHTLSPSELNELAFYYVTGDGVELDYEQARFLWLKAAEHGHAGAQYNLGQMYSTGTGVKRNPVKAALCMNGPQKQETCCRNLILG